MTLAPGIRETATALGVDPLDLATVISYETAGTFDPAKRGPTTQWGQHRGLIQFGEPQAQQYGVDWNDPAGSQLGADGAIVRYLVDNGFQKGGSLLDLYSTINAGGPGRYGASDANNGGAPGTVRDKVEQQFAPHRANAEKMMGVQVADASGQWTPAQLRAIEAAQARLAAPSGGQPATEPQWTPEQRAAIERAQARIAGEQQSSEAPPLDPETGMPAGMVMGPDGYVLDTKAEAEIEARKGGWTDHLRGLSTSAVKGIPFVGEYMDEAVGAVDEALGGAPGMARERARAAAAQFEQDHPYQVGAAQIGTGIATAAPVAMAAAPAIGAAAPASIAGRVGLGLGAGAVGGGIEGAVSGYGAGQGEGRAREALDRGVLGAGVGGAVGAAAPVLGRAAENIVGAVRGRGDRAAAAGVGMSPEAATVVGRMIQNDGPARAVANINAAGPGAMVADAGPATAGLLDAAIQKAGPGGQIARSAIDARAEDAGQEIGSALDQFLGKPRGLKGAARDISGRTAQVRKQAYDKAYASPIDYSAPEGLAVEEVLSRIPPRQLTAAVQEANEEMISRGVRNQQIMAEIGEDGTVAFREMPNIQQLDEIKKALDKAGSVEDIFGRPTAEAIRPRRLARELRKAIGDAAPDYNRAVALGGQKIAEDKALETGRRILQPQFTREDVADAIDGAGPELVRQAKIGLRRQVDEVMANVRRAIGDSSMDAREGVAAMKVLSSRATREKLATVLGEKEATALTGRIDRAAKAFELRARTADNSKTFARQSMNEAISDLTEPGAIATLMQGNPVNAGRKIVQNMTAMTPEARREIEDRIAGEIATALTQSRGANATRDARRMIALMEREPATVALARRIGQLTAAGGGASAYEAGTN